MSEINETPEEIISKKSSVKNIALIASILLNVGVIGVLTFKTIPDNSLRRNSLDEKILQENNYSNKTKVNAHINDTYLTKKEGFGYVLDNTKFETKFNMKRTGIEKSLEILCDQDFSLNKNSCKYFYLIRNYIDGVFPETTIYIHANPKKQISRIHLKNRPNNFEMTLSYDVVKDFLSIEGPVDEKNGKILFEKYSKDFKEFIETEGIDQKIKDYVPEFNIRETKFE